MNHHFNPQINWQPFNNHQLAIQAQNKASSSASSTLNSSPQSAFSRVDQIGKKNFPMHANAQMPYVNLSWEISPAQTNSSIQKQKKTRASAQKTQQVSCQSVLKEAKKKNYTTPSQKEIEALYHMSLKNAAAMLEMSQSKLKKHCREYGIEKWPYRSAQKQLNEIEEELRCSFAQNSNSSVSSTIYQSSSSGSSANNQVDVEDSSSGYANCDAEEPPHTFRPIIESEDSQRFLYSHVPEFQISPLTPLLPPISQLNLTPLRLTNEDKPLTGDAILRRARLALKNSTPSLHG